MGPSGVCMDGCHVCKVIDHEHGLLCSPAVCTALTVSLCSCLYTSRIVRSCDIEDLLHLAAQCNQAIAFCLSQSTCYVCLAGAGKTTLMSALAGKATYGVVSGLITINGRQGTLDAYKHVMGYVPQDDIMHRALTVEENLMYSACFR